MKKIRDFGKIMLVFVFLFCLPLFLMAQEKQEGDELYTIKKGDTLWDISSRFLKDPFLWPNLWQRNPYITNPHWIFPGQPIRLTGEVPGAEQPKAMVQEPVAAAMKEEPSVMKMPEAEVMPAEVNPPQLSDTRYAGFMGNVDYEGIGIIVENREGKAIYASDDIVYLAFKTDEPVVIGNKYTIFRPSEIIRHPLTNQRVGRKYTIHGNVEIIDQYGSFYTGKIIEAFFAMRRGDRIMPYLKEMEVEAGQK